MTRASAAGSTRKLTEDLVMKIKRETELNIVSHLTCVGSSKKQMLELLRRYESSGITNILALRGFQPIEFPLTPLL